MIYNISLKFYYFSKRKNSTKQPTSNDLLFEEEVVLKSTTSLENPIFILSNANTTITNLLRANYVQWDDKYYWINEKHLMNNEIIEFDCRIDSLATEKIRLLNQEQFVLYSSSHYSLLIDDARNPVSNRTFINKLDSFTPEFLKTKSFDDIKYSFGTIVLTVLDSGNVDSSNRTNGLFYYMMTVSEFSKLVEEFNESDFISKLLTDINNPFTYIINCKWYPFNLKYAEDQEQLNIIEHNTKIKMGQWNSRDDYQWFNTWSEAEAEQPVTWYLEEEHYFNGSEQTGFDIVNDYRISDNRAQLMLLLPIYGKYLLPISHITKDRDLLIRMRYDFRYGVLEYAILAQNDGEGLDIIDLINVDYGVSIPVGGQESNKLQAVAGTISSIIAGIGTGVASGSLAVGLGTALAGSSGSNIMGLSNSGVIKGFGEAFLPYLSHNNIGIYAVYKQTYNNPQEYQTKLGLLCMRTLRLSNLSGYCQCQNASVELPEDGEIIDEINNYLNGGFYIE